MSRISIIMPLFNAAKYLPEALQSVLNQTYREFELICIDDCSTDDTAEILMNFQRKDERIKVLENKERLGAGPSRNRGLKAAKGKYVIFLDGDDIFEEELLEKANAAMERYQTDIVLFEALHVPSETIYTKRVVERPDSFIRHYCKTTFCVNDFGIRDFPNRSNAPWSKMFRRNFLQENKLEFQDLPSNNDVYFVNMAMLCAKRIIWLDDRRVMVYVRDHFEPSRISNDRDPMCAYYAMEKLAIELNKRNMLGRFAEFYYGVLADDLLYLLTNGQGAERKRSFYLFLKKEGFPKCIEYGKESYNEVDSYYRYALENIINSTDESEEITVPDTYFQYYLKKNGQTVLTFIKDKLDEGKKIVLWGIGINGKSLLDYLEKYAVKISAITDMDRKKQGSMVNGYRILDPDDICHMADLIITTSKQVLWEIKDRTENLKIELTDILELLKTG